MWPRSISYISSVLFLYFLCVPVLFPSVSLSFLCLSLCLFSVYYYIQVSSTPSDDDADEFGGDSFLDELSSRVKKRGKDVNGGFMS